MEGERQERIKRDRIVPSFAFALRMRVQSVACADQAVTVDNWNLEKANQGPRVHVLVDPVEFQTDPCRSNPPCSSCLR